MWEISTKAHYGNEHFAIYPEDLIARIIKFGTEKEDWVLNPFVGRGTTGIVCATPLRNFTGIDLYQQNVNKSKTNIGDSCPILGQSYLTKIAVSNNYIFSSRTSLTTNDKFTQRDDETNLPDQLSL